jgi:hypothetical protein
MSGTMMGFFSLCHHIQTGSGTHPASYPVGTRALSPGVEHLGCEADCSSPSRAEVMNVWSYTPHFPSMSSWCCALLNTEATLSLYLTCTEYLLHNQLHKLCLLLGIHIY